MVNQNLEWLRVLILVFLSHFETSHDFIFCHLRKFFEFLKQVELWQDFEITIKDYFRIMSYSQIQIAHTLRST